MIDPYHLLPLARQAASRVVRSPLLADEAGERAVHMLTLAMLGGFQPNNPEAWLRVVARRSACALLRSEWGRIRNVEPEEVQTCAAPYGTPRHSRTDYVRECLEPRLTSRQQEALHAALSTNTTRAAARSIGMQPRDFRRYLNAITRKARGVLAEVPFQDTYADDVGVQFGLST